MSFQTKLIITVFFILSFQTFSSCPQSHLLPSLHKTAIQMNSMYKDESSSSTNYHYIYNYPSDILKSKSKQAVLYIHQTEWENKKAGQLKYRLEHSRSATALLLKLGSSNLVWNIFQIGILFMSERYQHELSFGQIQIIGSQSSNAGNKNRVSQKRIKYSLQSGENQVFSYLTGLDIKSTDTPTPIIQVQVSSSFVSNNGVVFTLNVGQNNDLQTAYISYIIWRESFLNEKSSGELILTNFVDDLYRQVTKMPSNYYYIFGTTGIKMKQGGVFSLNYVLLGSNILHVQTNQIIDYLKVSYFSISMKANLICSRCKNAKYIKNNGWEGQCLHKCSNNEEAEFFPDQTQACVPCYKQLNQTFSFQQKKCVCQSQYVKEGNRCVLPKDQSAVSAQGTFSLQDSSCLQANTMFNGRSCVCMAGYQKTKQGICSKICFDLSYWNGNTCIQCHGGSYPWQQRQQCRLCTPYCIQCQGPYSCRRCSRGFEVKQGKCVDICGDGIKKTSQCDDQNKNSGDGCSSSCQIEKGYFCQELAPNARDFCFYHDYNVFPAKVEIQEGNVNLNFLLSPFTEFTEKQLRQIISLNIGEEAFPDDLYFLQDRQKQLIVIRLFYGEMPIFNFGVSVGFTFASGKRVDQMVSVQMQEEDVMEHRQVQ